MENEVKSDFLSIPGIGVQDGKIALTPTLSQESPLETISKNTNFSSFGFTFFLTRVIFLIFSLRGALEPLKNVLSICDLCDTHVMVTVIARGKLRILT